MKAPDKIYMTPSYGEPDNVLLASFSKSHLDCHRDIEYIRKDALLEWLQQGFYWTKNPVISVQQIIDKLNSMNMTRAEEAAKKKYPIYWAKAVMPGGNTIEFDANENTRNVFKLGYETAEKYLAPLIEAAMIVYEAWNGGTMDDVRRGMVELEKRFKEAKK